MQTQLGFNQLKSIRSSKYLSFNGKIYKIIHFLRFSFFCCCILSKITLSILWCWEQCVDLYDDECGIANLAPNGGPPAYSAYIEFVSFYK